MTLAYINLELCDEDKEFIDSVLKNSINEEEYCYLKRKGGNQAKRAHLTLFFGLEYEKLNIREIKNDLSFVANRVKELKFESSEIFYLKNASCNALVARIADENLTQTHNLFKKYPYNQKRQNIFKPHITLAYIKKDAKLDLSNMTKLLYSKSFKICKYELKIFGPRKKVM